MTRRRLHWLGVLIAGLFSGAPGAIGPATRVTAEDAKPAGDLAAKSFFAQHCQTCHAGTKPKGNFRLDSLSPNLSDKANREKWLAVLEKVKSGAMPPKEKPRPPAQDVKALTDWISGRVEKAGAGQGRVVLRRLNRAEYENTVRDLMRVEIDLKDVLPADPGKLDQLRIVEVETIKTLRDFLAKLKQSREAGATLLDRTMVYLGSNLGDGSSHSVKNLLVLLAGGGFKHGQHLHFDQENPPPLCNLYVSMLQRLGIEADKFSTGTGTLTGLEAVG